ncbi:MAG: hypothetical protein ABIO65_01710 [Nitrospiria bacterium]
MGMFQSMSFAGAWMVGLWLVAATAPAGVVAEEATDTIEIVIEESVFHLAPGRLTVDADAVIVLRNLDAFEHGFASPAFRGLDILPGWRERCCI